MNRQFTPQIRDNGSHRFAAGLLLVDPLQAMGGFDQLHITDHPAGPPGQIFQQTHLFPGQDQFLPIKPGLPLAVIEPQLPVADGQADNRRRLVK